MKLTLCIILLFLSSLVYPQNDDTSSIGYLLKDCHLVYDQFTTTDFCGTRLTTRKKALVVKSIVQKYQDFETRIDTIKNVVFLYYTSDSLNIVRDSLFNQIRKYLSNQGGQTYLYFPIKSFFINDGTPIPFSLNVTYLDRTNIVFYLSGEIFKIELLDEPYGALEAFLQQNFQLKIHDRLINLIYPEKRMKEALELAGF